MQRSFGRVGLVANILMVSRANSLLETDHILLEILARYSEVPGACYHETLSNHIAEVRCLPM